MILCSEILFKLYNISKVILISTEIMEQVEKRQVPGVLRKILAVDAYLTDQLAKNIEKFLPLKQLKIHNQTLEISCHTIPWIACWLAFIWIVNSKDLYQMQVNFMLGLLLDIFFIAIIKAITRRRRPSVNTDPFGIGPDKYSFPSGHASRAAFIAYFFINLWVLPIFCIPPLLAWVSSVCLSRILMRKHHILDISAGILLGIFEGMIIGLIYLEPKTCANLIFWVTDEKLDGAEYDV